MVGVKSRVWGELRQAERQRLQKEGKRAEVWNGGGGCRPPIHAPPAPSSAPHPQPDGPA